MVSRMGGFLGHYCNQNTETEGSWKMAFFGHKTLHMIVLTLALCAALHVMPSITRLTFFLFVAEIVSNSRAKSN